MKYNNINIILALAASLACAAPALAEDRSDADTLINMPFSATISRAASTGASYVVTESQLEKRTFGDLRNKFTGLVPGLEVLETGGSYFLGTRGNNDKYEFASGSYSTHLKGFGGVTAIVDDVAIPFTHLLLDPNQIESVTVVSDILDKVKAGPIASYGAVVIKTKRGGYNTPLTMHYDFESGVNIAGLIPEWLSGPEYAQYSNIARAAAGYSPLYSDEDIAEYAKYDPFSLSNPCVNYKDLLVKTVLPAGRFSMDASAGSEKVKYYFAINGFMSDELVKGPERTAFNKINFTGNVTTKVGRWIEASAGFTGLLGISNLSQISWNNYRSVPEIAFPLILKKETSDLGEETTFYGVTKTYGSNYYAKMMEGGFQTIKNRAGSFNAAVDVDLSFLIPGLKSRSFIQASQFMTTDIQMNNDYNALYWDKDLGIGEASPHDGTKASARSLASSGLGENLAFYERLSYDWARKGHTINAAVNFITNRSCNPGNVDFDRFASFTGNFSWSYGGRYAFELAAQYTGCDKFAKGARYTFCPTAGFAWTASNEAFLKDVEWLDKARIYAQAGCTPDKDVWQSGYLYETVFSNASGAVNGPSTIGAASSWFGSEKRTSTSTTFSRYGNPELSWCRVYQADAGIELEVLDGLRLSADWYIWSFGLNGKHGQLTDVSSVLPSVSGLTGTTYDNYNQSCARGFDIALSYGRQIGDFGFRAGGSLSRYDRKYTLLANDVYPEGHDWLKRTGTSYYEIRGLECIGKYESQDEIDALPAFGTKTELSIGDLKYRDVDEDGVINSNDYVVIGKSNPDFYYSVNLELNWRNFDFLLVGTGQYGVTTELTNDFFTNGSGEGNMSAFVKDPKYPNLSYVKSSNNFANSNYWLTEGDWFKIQAVDLGYNLKLREKSKKTYLKGMRFDLRGENLLTLTKLQYIDPEATGSGVSRYPLFMLLTAGVKLTF